MLEFEFECQPSYYRRVLRLKGVGQKLQGLLWLSRKTTAIKTIQIIRSFIYWVP